MQKLTKQQIENIVSDRKLTGNYKYLKGFFRSIIMVEVEDTLIDEPYFRNYWAKATKEEVNGILSAETLDLKLPFTPYLSPGSSEVKTIRKLTNDIEYYGNSGEELLYSMSLKMLREFVNTVYDGTQKRTELVNPLKARKDFESKLVETYEGKKSETVINYRYTFSDGNSIGRGDKIYSKDLYHPNNGVIEYISEEGLIDIKLNQGRTRKGITTKELLTSWELHPLHQASEQSKK